MGEKDQPDVVNNVLELCAAQNPPVGHPSAFTEATCTTPYLLGRCFEVLISGWEREFLHSLEVLGLEETSSNSTGATQLPCLPPQTPRGWRKEGKVGSVTLMCACVLPLRVTYVEHFLCSNHASVCVERVDPAQHPIPHAVQTDQQCPLKGHTLWRAGVHR